MEIALKKLNPLWIKHRDKNVGLMFKCPVENCRCSGTALAFFWAHPSRPKREVTGDTFETITFETGLSGIRFGCTFVGNLKNGIVYW